MRCWRVASVRDLALQLADARAGSRRSACVSARSAPFLRPIFARALAIFDCSSASSCCLEVWPDGGERQDRPEGERQRDGCEENADAHATAESRFAAAQRTKPAPRVMEPCERPCAAVGAGSGSRGRRRARPASRRAAVCQNGCMAATKTSFGRDPGCSPGCCSRCSCSARCTSCSPACCSRPASGSDDPAHLRRPRGCCSSSPPTSSRCTRWARARSRRRRRPSCTR